MRWCGASASCPRISSATTFRDRGQHRGVRAGRAGLCTGERRELNVLDRFGVGEDDLLGEGGEARVYALRGGTRVLRLMQHEAVAAHRELLEVIRPSLDLPFAIPKVLDCGDEDGAGFCIEERIPGRSLKSLLPELSGDQRRHALESYANAVVALGRVSMGVPWFGELVDPLGAPLRADTWLDLLRDRVASSLAVARRDLAEDVPDLERVLADLNGVLPELCDPVRHAHLVHGDFFPGNVMADDAGNVTGVIDFSGFSLAGDPRMDLAGAVVFLEVVPGTTPDDGRFVLGVLSRAAGDPELPRAVAIYRAVYSLIFGHTKRMSPRLYSWCVENLRAGFDF